MSANEHAHWAAAHPDVTIDAEAGAPVASGAYQPLLYLMQLPADNSIEGYLRCVECGYTALAVHRLLRVRRSDYSIRALDAIDSMFVLDDLSDTVVDFTPSMKIREDSFAIEFECEEAHRWFVEIGNHKGTVIAAVSPGGGRGHSEDARA